MAQQLEKIKPGDLIRSDLINAILESLDELSKALSGVGGVGLVTVPSVIGRQFAEASTTAKNPTTHMGLGAVFDVTGVAVTTTAQEAQTRIVINQDPPPGARVQPGTPLKLVLSARAATGGGPAVPLNPVITSFTPTRTRIGDPVTIRGNNFELAREDNQVSFAGTQAATPLSSNREEIVVIVPDIPQPPTGTQERSVAVSVTTINGTGTGQTIVLAKSEIPTPAITSTQPNIVTPGDSLSISGTAFAPSPTGNTVTIDTQNVTPTGGSGTTLVVPVPQNLFTGMSSGTTRQVNVRVRNNTTGQTSPTGTRITLGIPEPG